MDQNAVNQITGDDECFFLGHPKDHAWNASSAWCLCMLTCYPNLALGHADTLTVFVKDKLEEPWRHILDMLDMFILQLAIIAVRFIRNSV